MAPLPILEHPAQTAGLVRCWHCDHGFRRASVDVYGPRGGVHIGSQRKGMIPDAQCQRVFAVYGGNMTDNNAKPYLAYVDGAPIKNRNGVPRRFATARTAYMAACRAAPYRGHDGNDRD